MEFARKLLLILSALYLSTSSLFSQSYLLDNIQTQGMKDGTHVYKIVVLPFQFKGLSISTATSFSKEMAQSLVNTNRFEVINPEQVENYLIEKNSPLLGCREISCGIQIAKEFDSEYLLVSHLTLLDTGDLKLISELVEIKINNPIFSDYLFFKEDDINEYLYIMSNRIVQHVPLVGVVVQANKNSAVVTLGRNHSVAVGDQMVIYKQEGYSNSNELPFETTLNKTRAIIKINRVAETASEGAIIYQYDLPDPRDKVRAILNVEKQVDMIAQARREIDDAYKVKKEEKLDVVAPVALRDRSRHEWLERYKAAKSLRDTLNYSLIGVSLLTAYFYSQDGFTDTKTLIGLGGMAFLGYEYVHAHYALDEIIEEGRFKDYIDNTDVPFVQNKPTFELYKLSYKF